MKTYKQGLITGILLTASAMMFMGAYDDYYDRKIWRTVQNIENEVDDIKRKLNWGVDCN